MLTTQQRRDFLIKFAFWGALGLLAFGFIHFLLGPLTPFIIAFTVAALLQGLMRWVEQRWTKIPHGVVATVLTVLSYVLLLGLVLLLLVGLFSAAIDWASDLPDYFTETITPWLEEGGANILGFVYMLDPSMGQYLQEMLPDALSAMGTVIMDFSVNLVSWASSVGTKLPGAMLAVVVCVIATAFLSRDYAYISSSILSVFPERAQVMLRQAKTAIVKILGNFARSYVLILFITFLEIWIGLEIINFENAIVIAAIIAVFDILPIVGSGMVLLPWTIFKFVQGDVGKGIGLLILYLWVVIARQVIEPRIVSKRVGLHPLSTLLFMWMGLKIFGGVGMLALPICVLILKDLHESGFLNNIVEPVNERCDECAMQRQEEENLS